MTVEGNELALWPDGYCLCTGCGQLFPEDDEKCMTCDMGWQPPETMPEEPGPYDKRVWILAYFPSLGTPPVSYRVGPPGKGVVKECTPYFARLHKASAWMDMPEGPNALV